MKRKRSVALSASCSTWSGLCCVEMFLTTAGKLVVNEIAPRPHNSGHLTIEACSRRNSNNRSARSVACP